MTSPPFPLFDVFEALRRHHFNVGLPEYFLALEALQHGLDTGSREGLIAMCQTVWANSLEEQQTVAAVFEDLLPERWGDDEIEQTLAEAEHQESPTQQRQGDRSEDRETEPVSKAVFDDDPALSSANVITRFGTNSRDHLIAPNMRFRRARSSLDFVGELPVTRRQMKRAWRYYRRMQQAGPPTELDVHATIQAMYQTGVLDQPVLVQRRTNQACMLLLIDEGGSMVPFQYVVQPLINTAQNSGLAHVAVYYFHDAPGDYLFRDPQRTRPERFEEAIAPFKGAGILIVSDAGAARSNHDNVRLGDTLDFLRRLEMVTPNMVWVNPTPEDRWAGTTANAICQDSGVRMFTLDRPGLDAAVDILRGRKR